jgi:hypothetical protein
MAKMMTAAAWQHTQELARTDGLDEACMAALAIGCPVHGNVSMDWDGDGVFCHQCERAASAELAPGCAHIAAGPNAWDVRKLAGGLAEYVLAAGPGIF